jgi:pSer/pThr/pTyr-binding forkhead associated (FHA) protein
MESPVGPHTASPAELQARLKAERAGSPFLLWREPAGQRILALGEQADRITVGRGDEVDVQLASDERVSRVHAEIERLGGVWTVADDGLSRNGSFVNDERVTGRRRLVDGDELRFGNTTVVFRAPAPTHGLATAAAPDSPPVAELTETQRKILIALSRPFQEGSRYATPATNQQVADEVFLSVDAVKGHLRVLFEKFGIGDLPQNQKRVRLVELALQSGAISIRELE